jgi:hypothetical protein
MSDPFTEHDGLRGRISAMEADIAADPAEDTPSARLELAELKDRADLLASRLPFVGVDLDELATQREAALLRSEELEVKLWSWPTDSAHHRKLSGERDAAVLETVQIKTEEKTRGEIARARVSMANLAEKQAREEAGKEWRAYWEGQLKELEKTYPAKNVPGRWELERTKTGDRDSQPRCPTFPARREEGCFWASPPRIWRGPSRLLRGNHPATIRYHVCLAQRAAGRRGARCFRR